MRDAGSAVPFAIVSVNDDSVIGSTRFWNLERWAWPQGHPRHGRSAPDACEIGYTWLTRSAIRTAANTEAKLLMLTHAFEVWGVQRVSLKTDARNERSRAAIERLGARYDGTLRCHMPAYGPGGGARDSAFFSIVQEEWPRVKAGLESRLGS